VRDFGSANTTFLAGNHEVGQFYGSGGRISSTGQGNYLILTGTQTVVVTGADTGVNNMGTTLSVTLSAAGDSMNMNGTHDLTTVTGDHIAVGDHGTGDTTLLLGNFDSADLEGSNGVVISSGHDNTITLSGSNQSVSVTGQNTLVVNNGHGLLVGLSAAGDSIELTAGSAGNATQLSGDGLSVVDYGTENVTQMAGDHEVGQFYGNHGVVNSTGSHDYLILNGSQIVTVTGAGTGINDLGIGSSLTLSGSGDFATLNGLGNSVSVTADGVSLRDEAGSRNQFAIASGAGNDSLHIDGSDGSDVASFGPGIAHDQLWFAQSGQDLVMSVVGKPQSLTLGGWYDGADHQLGEVTTADGWQVSAAGIGQLVQAMSAFQPPAAGQTTLPSDVAQALAPALAANWHHG
jgi:hypothetical protein